MERKNLTGKYTESKICRCESTVYKISENFDHLGNMSSISATVYATTVHRAVQMFISIGSCTVIVSAVKPPTGWN